MLAGSTWNAADPDALDVGDRVYAQGDESPREAFPKVISDLALSRNGWVQAGRHDGQWGQAQVCRIPSERVLHVVGNSEMAAGLRELLLEGSAPGWHLNPVVPGRTPLHELAEPLLTVSGSVRYHNLLGRSGFVTIEEVAATPDACLGSIHQAGPKMVTAIRDVLRALGFEPPEVTHPIVGGVVAERRAHIRAHLTSEQHVRYREFAAMLARSSIPINALEAIADSLNAETVPPADPQVLLLLSTAGGAELASYYQSCHGPPTDTDQRAELRPPEPGT